MPDPRMRCSPEQLAAAGELIQTFLYAINHQPQARAFNNALLLRAGMLMRGTVPLAKIRDDQFTEALDASQLLIELLIDELAAARRTCDNELHDSHDRTDGRRVHPDTDGGAAQ